MVVFDVEDLHIGAVGQPPVGDVGLPAFVGHLGAKPGAGALGALLRLRGDKPAACQDPPDRRRGRDTAQRRIPLQVPLQVDADGLRAGVQASLGQVLAQPHDPVLQFQADRPRIRVGPSRPRRERGLALTLIPLDQLLDPVPGDLVVPRHLALGASLDLDRHDHKLRQRHAARPGQVPTMSRDSCQLCREIRHLQARHLSPGRSGRSHGPWCNGLRALRELVTPGVVLLAPREHGVLCVAVVQGAGVRVDLC